jgi:hypothetical protein
MHDEKLMPRGCAAAGCERLLRSPAVIVVFRTPVTAFCRIRPRSAGFPQWQTGAA